MAVYFQFKSSTVRESIPIDGHFISVGDLKESVIERKKLRRGKRRIDSDLVISDYHTKVDYLDDGALIPCHTTVLIRRVPVQASFPIIVNPPPVPVEPKEPEVVEMDPDDLEWEELLRVINSDPFEPESFPSQSQNPAPLSTEMDEDSKIKALVETPALDWGRLAGRGFGGKTPPQGYVCHRCKVAGHFIQYCPTNGDPDYDFKRLRPPTGIPKSMLVATPDGSYALPTGVVAVLRPNEAAFDKAMEGLSSSTRSVAQLPPELNCRLCKKVMKDAVLTSKCCFDSFCDRCIRERIITKYSCVCGATNVLADDLIPNVTLRNTITRILESNSNSSSIGVASSQVLPRAEKQEVVDGTHESVSVKESAPAASQESAPQPDVKVEQKPVSDETPKEMKAAIPVPASDLEVEQRTALPVPDLEVEQMPVAVAANEIQWRAAAGNYMAYNSYWQPPYYGGVPYYSGFSFGASGGQGMMMPPPRNHMDCGMGFTANANPKRKRDEDREDESMMMPPQKDHGYAKRKCDQDREDRSMMMPLQKDHGYAKRKRDEVRSCGDMSSSKCRRSHDRPSRDSQLSKKNLEYGHYRDHPYDHYHKDAHQGAHPDHSRRISSHHRDHLRQSMSHYCSESKKGKLSFSSEAAPATVSGTRKDHYEPKATSVSPRINTMASVAYDESSDDDDVNFKRKPSWYKSSPPVTMEERERGWQNERWVVSGVG